MRNYWHILEWCVTSVQVLLQAFVFVSINKLSFLIMKPTGCTNFTITFQLITFLTLRDMLEWEENLGNYKRACFLF